MPFCYGKSMTGTSGVNGDRFFISPDSTTFILADGASGAGKEGKVVMSRICVNVIEENPFDSSELSAKEYLDKMIWKINNELIDISQKAIQYIFGTLVICVVHDNIATIASIGDSPAHLIQVNSVKRVAKAHKTYQNLIDMGVLTEEQAEEYVNNLHGYMKSMFDRFIPMVVPIYASEEVEIAGGDMIVLCSDGVSDYVKPEEIKGIVNPDDLSGSIAAAINTAKDRSIAEKQQEHYDDMTMVVYCH